MRLCGAGKQDRTHSHANNINAYIALRVLYTRPHDLSIFHVQPQHQASAYTMSRLFKWSRTSLRVPKRSSKPTLKSSRQTLRATNVCDKNAHVTTQHMRNDHLCGISAPSVVSSIVAATTNSHIHIQPIY